MAPLHSALSRRRALVLLLILAASAQGPALAEGGGPPPVQAPAKENARPAAPSPVGSYNVTGTESEGDSFDGVVVVEQAGEIFHVTWTLDGESYSGIGILTDTVFSAVVDGEERPQLAVYTPDGRGGWTGKWAEIGDRLAGTETWTRR